MQTSNKYNVLESALNDVSVETFLKEYWPNNFLHSSGPLERFFNLPGLDQISNLEDILRIYKNPIMVVGDIVIEETGGILNKLLVSPEEALSWYEKGAALEFDFTDLFIPELRNSINNLKSMLGLPQGTMTKAVMYAASKSGGFSAHFDGYCNFIFQLKGKKKWRIADNNNVKNPLQHYELIEAPYLPEQLNSYWKGDFPSPELSHGVEVELNTGSFLFLPRGSWHSTSSSDETISLNFTFGQPAWLDLLLIELKNQLIKKDEWRELAITDSLDSFEQEQLKNKLHVMLNNLSEELNNINPDNVIHRGKEDLDTYQSTQQTMRQLMSIKEFL